MTRARWTRRRILVTVLAVFVPAGVAWAYWTATSAPEGHGGAAATTVNQGATPTATVAGNAVTVGWDARTLASGQAVDGYAITRYDVATQTPQTLLTACTGTIVGTTCTESAVPVGNWVYSVTAVFATNWRGAVSAMSPTATILPPDSTAPVNAVTMTVVAGDAYKSGDTIYYRGADAGSFTLTNAVTDAGSGPASSATATTTGTSTGWTHSPSTVSTPAGGPYVSTPFSWTAGTTTTPGEVVTGRDVAGNTTTTTLSFVDDSTIPSAGTITYTDGYQSGRSVTVTFASSSDSGSGIATGQLQRASALLSNGVCGTYTNFLSLGAANPGSPHVDSLVANSYCYQYRYSVTDRLGNQAVATTTSVAKVDYAGAVNTTTGALSQWRLGDPNTALASDLFTGANGSALLGRTPDVGGAWAHLGGTSTSEMITGNRVRRNGPGYSSDYTTTVMSSANYSVEADFFQKGTLASDAAAVMARANTTNGSYYMARWETDHTWNIVKWSGTSAGWLGTTAVQPDLTVGQTYRVRLEVSGSATTTLKLYVNGVLLLTGTDSSSPFIAAGKAGIVDGNNSGGADKTDLVGIHIDNFMVYTATSRAADSKGSNTGDYFGGVTLGAAGALGGDLNTAAQFDGANDYVQAVGTTGIPVGSSLRSVEMWFKTTSSAQQMLFSYGSLGNTQEFGLWLDTGGTAMTAWGWGTGNDKTFTLPAAVNNGAWHQVVKTYNGTSITLYIDGVALPSQTATRSTVMNAYGFNIGAMVTPSDSNTGRYFTGSLDEVSLYTTALTQATVTNHFALGTSATGDVTGPTGGSVDAGGLVGTGARYSTSTQLSLTLAKGTDPSGVGGAQLLRAAATLASGSCGAFGGYVLVSGGTDPASPKSTTVADQACYSFQYVVYDTTGNATTYTSPDIKVDLTAPTTPSLAFSAFTNTYWSGTGSVYYKSAATSGSFTATATAIDSASGIASYAFPSLGTNWTSTPGALGVTVYSWTGAPAAPGTVNVTATNNAAATSSTSPFTLVDDNTAPSAGTVTYTDGTQSGTTISVAFTTGTDGGSGLGTRLLQRASAPLTGSTCDVTYSGWTTITGGTNPVSSPVVDTVTAGNCYKYQYVVADGVGNQHVAGSASVVKVTPPATAYTDAVNATSGLLNYYRLADSAGGTGAGTVVASDVMSGSNGTLLTARAPDVGGAWAYLSGGTANTIQVDTGRAHHTGTGYAIDYVTATPPSPNYSVQTDLVNKTATESGDRVGVIGRLDTAAKSYYMARWEQEDTSWNIMKVTNESPEYLSYVASQGALTVGATYVLRLEISGNTSTNLKLYVNNVLKVEHTDTTSPFKNAGKAGIMDGDYGSSLWKTTVGAQFDNFLVTSMATSTFVADSKDLTNTGDHLNGVTLGQTGALTEVNNAVLYDGVNDYSTVSRTISGNMSIEFWFKSTQGRGTTGHWPQYAGLVDTTVTGTVPDFGISLSSSGHIKAGVGNPDTTITSVVGGYNDGLWHHVVFTRATTGGAFKLYVDGGTAVSGAGNTAALTANAVINFGRIAAGTNYYQGHLDEVAIYNSVLSAATVTAHYNAR
ncbi:LamG domain-containing protein [Lentzea sp. PSKA42]|uniref:LamG domain-containing protein n=1 Tax=Lentzea indica TaxID=2604800 RepID=A0ABX1FPK1_9PSEU|nr:LamG domain-containing protein [Lentzea indica]NKE60448.1 LamG domain-containing protein [Lentzea indica]